MPFIFFCKIADLLRKTLAASINLDDILIWEKKEEINIQLLFQLSLHAQLKIYDIYVTDSKCHHMHDIEYICFVFMQLFV